MSETAVAASTTGPRRSDLWRVLSAAGVALIALYVFQFVWPIANHQWDFRTLYLAARCALEGLNPYLVENLSQLAGRDVAWPFVYPPTGLLPILPLAFVKVSTAQTIWIGLKILLLTGLIAYWARRIAPGAGLLPVALLAVFGWNGAALVDLQAGNVALLECALLWGGFACYAAGRRVLFAALILLASIWKLAPAAYLLLLLVPAAGRRPSPRGFLAALAVWVVIVWFPLWIGPAAHWEGFLAHLPDASRLGESNPSSWSLSLLLWERTGLEATQSTQLAAGTWVLYALAMVASAWPVARRAWRAGDGMRWAMIGVFLDLLLAPRPMAYGFIRLGAAPLYFAPEPFHRAWGPMALALFLSAQGLARAFSPQLPGLLPAFAPLLLTLGVWLLVVRGEARPRRAVDPRTASGRSSPEPAG